MKISHPTILLLLGTLAACSGTEGDTATAADVAAVDTAAEARALMERSREWSATVGRGDMEAALDYWAQDAVLLSPGMPIIEGQAAIRSYVEQAGSIPGFRISWEPISAHVAASGDLAYMIERNEITMNDSTGAPVTERNKVVTVWRKGEDGVWRNVVDAWNEDPSTP